MAQRYGVKLDKNAWVELSHLVKQDKVAIQKRTHAQVLRWADAGRQGPAWTDEVIAEPCRVTGARGGEYSQTAGAGRAGGRVESQAADAACEGQDSGW